MDSDDDCMITNVIEAEDCFIVNVKTEPAVVETVVNEVCMFLFFVF